MTPKLRTAFTGFFVVAVCFIAEAQKPSTLGQTLDTYHITAPPADAGEEISSYAVLDSESETVIAYWVPDAHGRLTMPLHILRYARDTRLWRRAQLFKDKGDAACGGSVLAVRHIARRYYVELHVNPSASCTLVLNEGLQKVDTIAGWVVSSLDSGEALIYGNEVHFAPFHPVEMFLYFPENQQLRQVYPFTGDHLRNEFVNKVSPHLKVLLESGWCARNDQPCRPDTLDADADSFAANDQLHAFAFRVALHDVRGDGASSLEAVYVLHLAGLKIDIVGLSKSAAEEQYGTSKPSDLIGKVLKATK